MDQVLILIIQISKLEELEDINIQLYHYYKNTYQEVLKLYRSINDRLTGYHQTSSYDTFLWGDGYRGGSIRIPVITNNKQSHC